MNGTCSTLALILVMMVAVVGFIVMVETAERRIPVQYAKRVIGRRVMGGQSTHMPLKVNAGGVIPVIFASSILAFPQTIATLPVCQEQCMAERNAGPPDGQTLVVRGYLGISLLGKNQYWTRLPETAFNEIDSRFNPHPPPAPGRKPAGAMKSDSLRH